MTISEKVEHSPPKESIGARVLTPLALGAALNPVNSTMISTALGPIRGHFHATVAQAGWLIAGLYLASAVAQPMMGRLADLYGARRIYMVGLLLVAVAGAQGMWAGSLLSLVASRVLLGIGTSAAYPSAMKILRTESARRGFRTPRVALGIMTLASITISAIGPTLGGVLTDWAGWPSIFAVNIPLAGLALAMTLAWLPADAPIHRTSNAWSEVDWLGIMMFTGALLSLMIFLMHLQQPEWWILALSATLFVVLVAHSRRKKSPFIDVRMLVANKPLSATYIRNAAMSMMVYSVLYGFAQWLESGPGFSSTQAGLVTLPMSIIAGVCAILGARTKGIRAPMLFGIGAMLTGSLVMTWVHSASSVWLLAVAVSFFGFAQGFCFTSIQAAVYVQAPAQEMGTAAGLQRTSQYVGAIAASTVLGLVYGTRTTDAGLHSLALLMALLCALLFAATIADKTFPRGELA